MMPESIKKAGKGASLQPSCILDSGDENPTCDCKEYERSLERRNRWVYRKTQRRSWTSNLIKFRKIKSKLRFVVTIILTNFLVYTIYHHQYATIPAINTNTQLHESNAAHHPYGMSNNASLAQNIQGPEDYSERVLNLRRKCGKLYDDMTKRAKEEYVKHKSLKRIENELNPQKNGIHFSLKSMGPSDFRHFIYDDANRLIYCYVPKVACTNWKRVLLVLAGKGGPTPLDIRPDKTHDRGNFKFLSSLNQSEIAWRLSNYLTFLVVRDPLERVLSAFRDKFEMSYSEYFQKVFGTKIIDKYRPDASEESLSKGNDVTFEEFLTYLMDMNNKAGLKGLNEHWLPAHAMCHPCALDYDILAKYETLEVDSNYILRIAKADKVRFPPMPQHHVGNRKTQHMIKRYMRRLPPNLMWKLRKIYSTDAYLFDYEFKNLDKISLPLDIIK